MVIADDTNGFVCNVRFLLLCLEAHYNFILPLYFQRLPHLHQDSVRFELNIGSYSDCFDNNLPTLAVNCCMLCLCTVQKSVNKSNRIKFQVSVTSGYNQSHCAQMYIHQEVCWSGVGTVVFSQNIHPPLQWYSYTQCSALLQYNVSGIGIGRVHVCTTITPILPLLLHSGLVLVHTQ